MTAYRPRCPKCGSEDNFLCDERGEDRIEEVRAAGYDPLRTTALWFVCHCGEEFPMVTWTADLLNTQINMVHDDTRKLVTEEELFGDHNWFGQVSERPLIETIIPWKGIKETNQC